MATIIRKDGTSQATACRPAQPIAFSFADMRGQADVYLETVRAEAAKIVQQARRDSEKIRRDAEVAGRKVAEAAAEKVLDEKVARRMATIVPALEQLVKQVDDAKGELQAHWERSAVQVAIAIAERIIRRELKSEPQIALETIAETLRLAAGSSELVVRVSATDYEHLGPQIEHLATTLGKISPNQIIADETITPGGCHIETKFGEVDQRIESQLRRIEEDLA